MPDFLDKAKQAEDTKNPDQLDSPARSMQVVIHDALGRLSQMPADQPAVKKLVERVNAVNEKFQNTVVRVQGDGAYNHLREEWAALVQQTDGWQSDSIGVTLSEFTGPASEKTANLGSPKAVDLVRVSNAWLNKNFGAAYGQAQGGDKDNYYVFLREPRTRALVDDVMKQRDAAEAKLAEVVIKLLDEAEKSKLTPEARDRFQALIERTLPESVQDSPMFKPTLARMKRLVER